MLGPRQAAVPRVLLSGIVITGGVENLDVRFTQPGQLFPEESLGLEGKPLSVEQVAGDQKRLNALGERQVDSSAQGGPRALPQAAAQVG